MLFQFTTECSGEGREVKEAHRPLDHLHKEIGLECPFCKRPTHPDDPDGLQNNS